MFFKFSQYFIQLVWFALIMLRFNCKYHHRHFWKSIHASIQQSRFFYMSVPLWHVGIGIFGGLLFVFPQIWLCMYDAQLRDFLVKASQRLCLIMSKIWFNSANVPVPMSQRGSLIYCLCCQKWIYLKISMVLSSFSFSLCNFNTLNGLDTSTVTWLHHSEWCFGKTYICTHTNTHTHLWHIVCCRHLNRCMATNIPGYCSNGAF